MNVRNANVLKASGATKVRGFTLVELMVAMLLGLIVIAGVSSVFLANLRSYKSNTALGDVQSNARIAFEIMARDIRQAGLTGCNSMGGRLANVLNNGPKKTATPDWWATWTNAVHGYDDGDTDAAIVTGMPARASSTDALTFIGAVGGGLSVATDDPLATNFKLNDKSSKLQTGDIVMICNPDHSVIAQVTDYDATNVTVVHGTGGAISPGNCSKGLGFPTDCSTANGNLYTFGPNAVMSKMAAQNWYIGTNPVGGRSLYRISLELNGDTPTPTAQEMVRNVTDMQITYHKHGDPNFVDAAHVGVANWGIVDAVHIIFTLQSADQRAGTDAKPLQRSFATTTSIRNRT